MKHTPLPWGITSRCSSPHSCDLANCPDIVNQDTIIATVHTSRPSRSKRSKRTANAAFIVQACNSYEALLETCKEVVETMTFEGSTEWLALAKANRKVIERLREAIAQALGNNPSA